MTRKWTITEKIIGGLEVVWGLFLLLMTIYSATIIWDLASRHTDIISSDQAIISILKKYHNQIILSILTIYGGTNLLLNKRTGWTTSLVTSLLNGIGTIINVMQMGNDKATEMTIVIFTTIISVTFLTTFLLLLNKQLRDKYVPTSMTWWTVGATVIVLLTDNVLF